MLTWHTDPGKGWTFDLLGRSLAELGVEPRAVLHVGGHHGEELPYYRDAGFKLATVIEPDPLNVTQIKLRAAAMATEGGMAIDVITAACGSTPGRTRFHRNALSFFSGLQPRQRGKHRTVDTFRVDVRAVSSYQSGRHNVLVIDTQGTELDALSSALLLDVDLLIIECWEPLPNGRPKVPCAAAWGETVEVLAGRGFEPRIRWTYDGSGYFDALFTPTSRT